MGGLPQDPRSEAQLTLPYGAEDVTSLTTHVFDLPDNLAAKADPQLIADDERHFALMADTLDREIADLSARLDAERLAPAGSGQAALDRDLEIHRLTSRLRTLRRFRLDLCLGRIVREGDSEPVYIGRLGLSDRTGEPLLIDWRAPAAEPFFAATHANPQGIVSRRRYRWTNGRITDYWDEVFTPEGLERRVALDDESAFIASLGASRSPRMRDVLSTIQADQDAIIRAESRGALVVDGGPGTGKTVVALHRTAYLLYSDPRLGHRRGGVLFVGPHEPYLAYVSDVLPSLGEEGVLTATLRDLVAEGATAQTETDSAAARIKETADIDRIIERAVRYHEEPPSRPMLIETPWIDVVLTPDDWAEAFGAADPASTHNDARDEVWEALLEILLDKLEGAASESALRRALRANDTLTSAFTRAWPILDAAGVVADLWSVPAYLELCAPWLTSDERRMLQRPDPRAWTESDLPFLDAARRRIGDPEAGRRRREREALLASEQEERARVIDHLIEADDSEMLVMTMLRGQDFTNTLVDEAALPTYDPDVLAGPFAHIVIDEAQELTDAQWRMLLSRCPSRSFTIVGDRAQARHGFTESWEARLARIGFRDVRVSSLTINYRTPEEVMAEAAPVIRAALPDANVPTSIRSTGVPVRYGSVDERDAIFDEWLATHDDGIAAVIGDPAFAGSPRIRSLTPLTAKGLEFDLVVLVEPESFGTGIEGAVDRYVSMTRATQRLVILRR